MRYFLAIVSLTVLLFGVSPATANPAGHDSCPSTMEMIDSFGGAVILDDQGDEDEGGPEDDESNNDEDDSDDE